jgi:cephalosporin hydroxylase
VSAPFSAVRSSTWRYGAGVPDEQFEQERAESRATLASRDDLQQIGLRLLVESLEAKYSYNWDWLGLPIIQVPQDIVALQELIWKIRPEVIVETGVARGGSLTLSASVLELIGEDGIVVGVDIDIREPNRRALEAHPLAHRIRLVQGSSIDDDTVQEVLTHAAGRGPAMVILDSMHTHAHVARELELYSPLVSPGSYLIVMDTVIEDIPEGAFADRPWGKGDNPKTAVHAFLTTNDRFEIDHDLQGKLLLTVAPDGYLRRRR